MTLFTYVSFQRSSMERNEQDAVMSFRQIEHTMQQMTQAATAMSLQVLLDNDCSAVLNAAGSGSVDAITRERALKRIASYREVNPNIQSIYLYNRNTDSIYCTADTSSRYSTATDFIDSGIIKLLNGFDRYDFLEPIPRTASHSSAVGLNGSLPVITYVLSDSGKREALENAVVVNLRQSWIYELIGSMYGIEDSAVLALDEKGQTIIDYKNGSDFTWDDENAQLLLEQAKNLATYSSEISQEGTRYYATCFQSEKNGWQYVKVAKWDTVFYSLIQVKNTALLTTVSVLIAALVFSLLITGNFYRIYSTVERNYNRVMSLYRGDSGIMRDAFLLDILTGKRHISSNHPESQFEKYNIPFSVMEDVLLMTLKIERYEAFRKRFGDESVYDIKYGIRNIFEEVACSDFVCIGVIEDMGIITLLAVPKEKSRDAGSRLSAVFSEFKTQVCNFVEWQFNMVYLEQPVSFDELPWVYSELKKHERDTFFYPQGACISLDKISEEHSGPLCYPGDLEKNVVKSVRIGDVKTARTLYERFVSEIISCQYDNFITGITLLCFAVTRLFEEYDESGPNSDYASYSDLIAQIYQAASPDEIRTLFFDMFDTLKIVAAAANSHVNIRARLDDAVQYINQHYDHTELSLETVAAYLSISASYLGKTFKKAYGISVTDCINQVRLQKIIEYLVNTDEAAKDIAEKCGFYNVNYFYTYFKKYFGVTPQVYRTRYKNGETVPTIQ